MEEHKHGCFDRGYKKGSEEGYVKGVNDGYFKGKVHGMKKGLIVGMLFGVAGMLFGNYAWNCMGTDLKEKPGIEELQIQEPNHLEKVILDDF